MNSLIHSSIETLNVLTFYATNNTEDDVIHEEIDEMDDQFETSSSNVILLDGSNYNPLDLPYRR